MPVLRAGWYDGPTRAVPPDADARCKDRLSSPARNFGVKGKMARIQGPGKGRPRNAAAFARRPSLAIVYRILFQRRVAAQFNSSGLAVGSALRVVAWSAS